MVIKGCPVCDSKNNTNMCIICFLMHYLFSKWTMTLNNGKTYIEIRWWCPFCGNELPSFIGWRVMKNGTEGFVVTNKNQSREKKEWP